MLLFRCSPRCLLASSFRFVYALMFDYCLRCWWLSMQNVLLNDICRHSLVRRTNVTEDYYSWWRARSISDFKKHFSYVWAILDFLISTKQTSSDESTEKRGFITVLSNVRVTSGNSPEDESSRFSRSDKKNLWFEDVKHVEFVRKNIAFLSFSK